MIIGYLDPWGFVSSPQDCKFGYLDPPSASIRPEIAMAYLRAEHLPLFEGRLKYL